MDTRKGLPCAPSLISSVPCLAEGQSWFVILWFWNVPGEGKVRLLGPELKASMA